MTELSHLQGWTEFIFYATIVTYGIIAVLSVIMASDFKSGFLEENGQFSSKTEKYFYYFFKISYTILLIILGLLLYFMYTILDVTHLL